MPEQKALLLVAKQGGFELGTCTIPQPGPDDILVKILATALNPIDWKIQKYGVFYDKFPAVVGTDAAGVVEQIGSNVTGFKKGDRVIIHHPLASVYQGLFTEDKATFREYSIVPAEIVAKIPDNISFDQAATVPLGLATAAIGLYNASSGEEITRGGDEFDYAPYGVHGAGLTAPWKPSGEGKYKGQGILIFGGSSSVGQYAIQLARLSGFSPIVTTASLHNTDLLKSLGATHVIDRKANVVAEAQKILTTPPNVVFDAIAEDTQEQGWEVLAPNGTLILVLVPKDTLKDGESGKKRIAIFGNVNVQREIGRGIYANLTEFLRSGKIKPNRVDVLPGGLAGIPAGLKRMEENKVSGVKLVARPHETE
ncbi:GroES-like protein [Ramaria rubella]|nr:GroES-like protein [Ramaria rubella]